MNKNLVDYYHLRAAEYEKVYTKPERQEDLKKATPILQEFFTGHEVLEIACGTGYWTERIALSAQTIIASDINEAVLDIAQAKDYGKAMVQFVKTDLYQLEENRAYDSLFGGFIWSHILLQELDIFLSKVSRLVKPKGWLVFMDNRYVKGSNYPITEIDEQGNTYQARVLADGSKHLVLKNFPTEDFLKGKLRNQAKNIRLIELDYYWILIYQLKA